MELLTRNNFEDWMQKLMERLDRQDELLLSLRPSGKAPNPMESIRMFDNQDLCMLLQISKRTLQRYRSIGALPYKTLGKKTYYSEEDVLTFLSEHVKDFRKEDIAFYKARIHNFFYKDTKSREKTGIVPVFRGAAYLTEAMSKIIIFRKTDLTASGWS